VLAIGLPNALPDQNACHSDHRQNRAEHNAGGELTPDDSPPVPQPDFTDSHRTDDERGCLRTGVSSAADDERHEQRENDSFRNLLLEVAHRGCG
jgi:hypothetical protein